MLRRLLIAILLCSAVSLQAQTPEELSAQRNEQRANRGLTSYDNIFVDKGQWIVGASMSYSAHLNENYSLVIVDNIESMGYGFEVSSMGAYTFSRNNSVGARISYKRDLLRLDNSDISFGDEASGGVNLSMDDCYLLSHSFSMMAILRQYIPLSDNKRFALFNEVQLEGGGSQSKFTYDSPVQGSYSTSKEFALNFAPGITAFVTNRFALELNVGAMGISYSKTREIYNQVETGKYTTNWFNFKINIMSVNFAMTYYI